MKNARVPSSALLLRCAGVAFLLLSGCTDPYDPLEVANERLTSQMGGRDHLAQARYLRFDFHVEVDSQEVFSAKHLWDREKGNYRLGWSGFGETAEAIFNAETGDGSVFQQGQPVPGERADELLDQAYSTFLNDSYWLLMPWKVTDPGVKPTMLGPMELDGHTYDVIHLSFDSVGITPGDEHWIFLDPESGRVEMSAYILERFGDVPRTLDEATLWKWEDWQESGGVRFAMHRRLLRTKHDPFNTAHVYFSKVNVLEHVPDGVFENVATDMP